MEEGNQNERGHQKRVIHAHSLNSTCSFHYTVEDSITNIPSSKNNVETQGRAQSTTCSLLISKQQK